MQRFEDILEASGATVHYCQGDVDHNRTVTAFSGPLLNVIDTLMELARVAIPAIDLNRHVGVHPRIGALDVCPFLPISRSVKMEDILAAVDGVAESLAKEFDLPVFLYEKSERGRHEGDLPALRRGGFGNLMGRTLSPDFGPRTAHPHAGATVIGVRDFLVAMNVDFHGEDLVAAKQIAKDVRLARQEGDTRFLGVRALGLPLASRRRVQVSMNLTLPDLMSIDQVIEDVVLRGSKAGLSHAGNELIGVIRPTDLERGTLLPVQPAQVVEYELRF